MWMTLNRFGKRVSLFNPTNMREGILKMCSMQKKRSYIDELFGDIDPIILKLGPILVLRKLRRISM